MSLERKACRQALLRWYRGVDRSRRKSRIDPEKPRDQLFQKYVHVYIFGLSEHITFLYCTLMK